MEPHNCPTCGQKVPIVNNAVVSNNKPVVVPEVVINNPVVVPAAAVPKQQVKKTIRYTRDVTTFSISGETHSVKDRIKQIPGNMWINDKKVWRVPINETSVRMLEEIIAFQLSS